ncbi:MAG: ATP-binding cassette domain-containing protein [Clostridiales Family XIII bacterium]|jgi:energy-coupling factor transport system ATP-binding protein|nr:ATP-binding cassette domain-containing protein [Clostridiales Family XIII bacterium]
MEIFNITGFSFTYPGETAPAVSGLDLRVASGEFIVVCGKSGSGKSTFLRNLKPLLAPAGQKTGEIFFCGAPLESLPFQEQSQRIGFVFQDPYRTAGRAQDMSAQGAAGDCGAGGYAAGTAGAMLASGLSALGCDEKTVRLRMAEMAGFFGLRACLQIPPALLSGGQRQKLNLAADAATQPDVLILDEPTAQLDPIAAADFLEMLKKINLELGVTVLISEQRLEEVFPMADRALVMDQGQIIVDAPPRRAGIALRGQKQDMFLSMPTPMRIYMELTAGGMYVPPCSPASSPVASAAPPSASADTTVPPASPADAPPSASADTSVPPVAPAAPPSAPADMSVPPEHSSSTLPPLTVREGRTWLSALFPEKSPPPDYALRQPKSSPRPPKRRKSPAPAVSVKEAWFRYERNGEDILRGLSMDVPEGTLFCIVGGNGTGKSTALKLIYGAAAPYRGKISVKKGPVGFLPQDPAPLFSGQSVHGNLTEALAVRKNPEGRLLSDAEKQAKTQEAETLFALGGLLGRTYDALSGGERQRAALAKLLLTEPEILLLDEPTKGMDSHFKERFARILKNLLSQGRTVLMVSHDVEFCAKHADVCALFFDGAAVSVNPPRAFFSGNSYYTTAANRMSRHIFENAVTAQDVTDEVKRGSLPDSRNPAEYSTRRPAAGS